MSRDTRERTSRSPVSSWLVSLRHDDARVGGRDTLTPRRVADVAVVVLVWILDLVLTPLFVVDETMGESLVGRASGELVPVPLVIAAVGVMALVLTLRRRYPLTVFLVVLALSVGLCAWLEFAQPIAALAVATYAAASRGPGRRAWPVLALALAHVILTSYVVAVSYGEGMRSAWDLLVPLIFLSVLITMIWGFARLDAAAFARSETFAGELEARAEQAAREERHRIARELHDILAHSVSAMMMQAAGARAMAGSLGRDVPEDPRLASVEEALATIETTGSQSMRELHRLLGALRTSGQAGSSLDLDVDLGSSSQPGLDDLDDLVDTPRRSGLIVEIHRTGEPGVLDPSVGAAAYRVVQEALTNSLKHAGRGAVIDIYEAWQDREITVQVRCRGSHDSVPAARPDTPNGGTGLTGLRERVELAGGRFEADWVGDEFVTSATLPTLPASTRATDPRVAGRTSASQPPLARP